MLRTLADDIERLEGDVDLADALRIGAAVADRVAAPWPSLREDIDGAVAAALVALPEGERCAEAQGTAWTAANSTVDQLGRPVAIPKTTRRRAEEAVALEDEGMAVEEAAAAAGIDAGTVVAVRQAAASGYAAAPVVLAHGDPVWPERYADPATLRRLAWTADAVASLSEGDRALLRDALTLGHRETARQHGIARSTVSRRQERITAALTERITAAEKDYQGAEHPDP